MAVYAIFRRKADPPPPPSSLFERALNSAVSAFRTLQTERGSPPVQHVELMIVGKDRVIKRCAIYEAERAGVVNGPPPEPSRWLAVEVATPLCPIFFPSSVLHCGKQEAGAGIGYSFGIYLCSLLPFLAPLWPDRLGSPTHCCGLTTRILARAHRLCGRTSPLLTPGPASTPWGVFRELSAHSVPVELVDLLQYF